jgi:hypothetical protein
MKILHWNIRYGQCSSEENKSMTKKHIPKRQDILRIQYMIQNKTQVETVSVTSILYCVVSREDGHIARKVIALRWG